MERLNPMDAQFVGAEDEDAHASMAIACSAIFEGPAPSYREFVASVASRLDAAPIFRRKLLTVPFNLGPPVWAEHPDFDLRYHLRQTALPAPGSDEQLGNLMARVMGQRLDRDYPLWEYWLVEGLRKGRWALILKVHHAMVDGVAGTDLYRVLFDPSPEPSPQAQGTLYGTGLMPTAGASQVARAPSSGRLAYQAALDMVALPARTALALNGALAQPGEAIRRLGRTFRATAKLAASVRPAVPSSLRGPIGRQRRYAWARASLDDVKTIKQSLGGTVNDVVLAAATSGFRDVLLSRGEEPSPHMVPSLIPVSLRTSGQECSYENRVSLLVADLPVHVAEPADRLATVRAEMSALKEAHGPAAAQALVALGHYTPYPLTALIVRLGYRLPQRDIVTVTTNVPGPAEPLYGLGRKLVEIIPYVPIATTLRTGVSILSYCGNLTFGITADYDTTPDIDVMVHGIERGIADLLKAAGRSQAVARPK
jgi:WS/DGAT/MGAT family acyltransferase